MKRFSFRLLRQSHQLYHQNFVEVWGCAVSFSLQPVSRIWFWIRGSTHVCPPMIVHMLYEAYSQKFSNIHQTAAGFAFSFPYFISCWFWCERVFMSLAITILRHVMCTCTVAVSFKMVERPNRWISEVVDTSLQWCHSPPLAIHI